MPISDYSSTFDDAAKEWNVDPTLLRAVAQQESRGRASAVSSAGAQGVMQIMPQTQKDLGVTDPNDPVQSIYGGAKYLSQMLDKYKTPELALAAYNAGPGRVDQHVHRGVPLPAETQDYVPSITRHYQRLAAAAGPANDASVAPADADAARNSAFLTRSGAATDAVVPQPITAAPGASPDAAPDAAPDYPGFLARSGAGPAEAPGDPARLAAAPPGIMQKVGAGLNRAAHDITDYPAELLSQAGKALGLTNALSQAGVAAPSPEQTAASNQAGLADYNRTYGDSSIAGAARVGGQIAGTLPILALGGGMLGAAGDVGAAAAGRVAPMLGQAAEAGQALLGGTLSASSPGVNLLTRAASLGAHGALLGGAAGALTSGQSSDSMASQAASGAIAGGIMGPVAGALGAGVNAALGRSGGLSTDTAKLAQLARDKFDIPISAPQMSGNSLVRIANDQSSKLPFSGAGASEAATQAGWQRAMSKQIGEDAPQVTPEVMGSAAKRIGSVFNGVADRTKIAVDDEAMTRLGAIENEAGSAPLGAGGHDAIKSQIDNILGAAADGDGTLSGQAYQQLTRAGAPLERAQSAADPNVRYYAQQVRSALDDAFQRSASPEDQALLRTARGQWRAMKTIEDLVEKSPDGNLSPALLMGQVRSASSRFDGSTGGMAYTGGGDMGDLARIGQRFLKAPPNSGTPDRTLVNSLLGGGAVSAAIANPYTIAAVPAGLAANRVAGSYLRSGGLANRLIDSSLNPAAASASAANALSPAAALGYNALKSYR